MSSCVGQGAGNAPLVRPNGVGVKKTITFLTGLVVGAAIVGWCASVLLERSVHSVPWRPSDPEWVGPLRDRVMLGKFRTLSTGLLISEFGIHEADNSAVGLNASRQQFREMLSASWDALDSDDRAVIPDKDKLVLESVLKSLSSMKNEGAVARPSERAFAMESKELLSVFRNADPNSDEVELTALSDEQRKSLLKFITTTDLELKNLEVATLDLRRRFRTLRGGMSSLTEDCGSVCRLSRKTSFYVLTSACLLPQKEWGQLARRFKNFEHEIAQITYRVSENTEDSDLEDFSDSMVRRLYWVDIAGEDELHSILEYEFSDRFGS